MDGGNSSLYGNGCSVRIEFNVGKMCAGVFGDLDQRPAVADTGIDGGIRFGRK